MSDSKFEALEFDFIKKKPPKTMADVEKNLWKNNILFGARKHKDYLDVSEEDFSKQFTQNIEGKLINPSTFNIFRDSLSKVRKEL